MVVGDLAVGSITGDLAALASAAGFAGYTAVVRSAPDRDWSPVLPGYGFLMILICGVITVANGKTLTPPANDVALALLHGGLFIVGGTLLYNSASRNVPAAAMTVFAQTEMVLVPVWAFIVLAERPAVHHAGGRHDHPRCRGQQGGARRSRDPADARRSRLTGASRR